MPDVQALENGVVLKGLGLVIVADLCRRAVTLARDRSGIQAPPEVEATVALLELMAGRTSERGHADVRAHPLLHTGSRAEGGRLIDSTEAARRLGMSPRNVTRIAKSLNGSRLSPHHPWQFDPTAVEAYRSEQQ